MDRIDALISGGISIVLAVCGVLLSRALSKIDESIQQLWEIANECREHCAELHARVSVLEALRNRHE